MKLRRQRTFTQADISYFVIAYALMSEELAKYNGDTSLNLRKQFFNQGFKQFEEMSPKELEEFLKEKYPF